MAEAPEERSITPASTTRPCAHGKSTPSGARSMKPAAAETRTRSTMPNFESSAYVLTRSMSTAEPSARATALSALGTGHPFHALAHGRLHVMCYCAPASGMHGEPDQGAPERVGDQRMRRANWHGESPQHGRDAERDLEQGEHQEEQGRPGHCRAARRHGHVDEEPQQRDAEPAMHPVHGALPVMRQEATATEREVRAGEPRSRMPHIAAESELGEEDPEPDHGEAPELGGHGGMSVPPFRQHHEAAQDEERIHEMSRAHEIGQLEEHGDSAESDLHDQQSQESQTQPSRRARLSPAPRQHHGDEEEHGEGDGLEAMAELDEHLRLSGRKEAPVTERPVGAAETRAGGAHDVAHGHEEEEGDDGGPRPAAWPLSGHGRLPAAP